MGLAAQKLKVALPRDTTVDTEIDLVVNEGTYFLRARLNVSLPGIPVDTARALVDAAYQTCPYSKATCGNIDVTLTVR